MSASIAGSQAALKVLYPENEVPKSINQNFKTLNKLKKEKNFKGELAYVPIQNANPQGSGSTVSLAQSAEVQGSYVRFALTRVKHYGIARINGEAIEAATKADGGALVDLWENETKGIVTTELSGLSTHLFGNGTGVISTGPLAGITTVTITLPATTNMNYFELNMTIKAVSSATSLSPTVRAGSAVITGIDRTNRTLTTTAAWDTLITGILVGDFLVRAGDQAVGGVATVITGFDSYIEGGSSPGALFGLTRSTDPVRLAGQQLDCTGSSIEDAIVTASSLNGFQGIGYGNVVVMNNIEFASLKRSLGAKITYPREGGSGKEASHSFSGVVVEGENGPINIMADPFCPRNKGYLLRMEDFSLFSVGAAPHLQDYDGLKFLRIQTDDVWETRFVTYGNVKCKNPGPHVRLLNLGL